MNIAERSQQLLDAPVWQTDRVKLICHRIKKETGDVRSYYFRPDDPLKFSFKPGQFITLELPIGDEIIYRSYTISSSPSQPYMLVLTVKQVPDGTASNWLTKHLKAGDFVWATGPAGQFNLVDIPAEKYLFMSGGSGITPMMSMSRWLHDMGSNADICFIHSARSEQDIIFRDELVALSGLNNRFKTHYILEEPSSFSPFHGRINGEMLQHIVPDLHDRTLFICGPAPYMSAVKEIVKVAGFNMKNFYQESYAVPVSGGNQSMPADIAQGLKLELTQSGKAIDIQPDELILDALEKSGNQQPSACRAGVCGACKVQAIDGEVESSSQMTLTEQEIADGYFLSCCSRAKTDLKLGL